MRVAALRASGGPAPEQVQRCGIVLLGCKLRRQPLQVTTGTADFIVQTGGELPLMVELPTETVVVDDAKHEQHTCSGGKWHEGPAG